MGRPASSVDVHLAKGTYIKHPDRMPKQLPKAEGSPEKPQSIADDPRADLVWDEMISRIGARLAVEDSKLLQLYCELDVMRQDAQKAVVDEGVTSVRRGETVINGALRGYMNLNKMQIDLLQQMGATPASRHRVSLTDTESDEDNPMEAIAARLKAGKVGA